MTTNSMGTGGAAVPDFPRIEALTRPDGSGELTIQGTSYPIETTSADDARRVIIGRVAETATKLGRPVKVATRGPDGEWPIIVHPDGAIEANPAARSTPAKPATPAMSPTPAIPSTPPHDAAPTRNPSPASSPDMPPPPAVPDMPAAPARQMPSWPPSTATSAPAEPLLSGRAPTSFLTQPAERSRARWGLRGTLNKMGMHLAPSTDEQQFRHDVAAVSQHWDGPKTIAVINGKGGSAKTPTTIGLSSTFAIYGGGGVVAWSNHQMRGTLGWHTVQSPHAATTQDLLAVAPDLLTTAGQSGAMARFVHHQPDDRYDVLQADPTKTSDQQRTGYRAVDTIHELLCRFYRLIIMDSDNDESTPHWLRMVDLADLVVVATTTDPVRAEAGRLMLDSLRERGRHASDLANTAVVVVSQAHSDEPAAAGVAQRFRADLGLQATTIPYDQGMKRLKITHAGLQPATQRAYLAAAAMVARALNA